MAIDKLKNRLFLDLIKTDIRNLFNIYSKEFPNLTYYCDDPNSIKSDSISIKIFLDDFIRFLIGNKIGNLEKHYRILSLQKIDSDTLFKYVYYINNLDLSVELYSRIRKKDDQKFKYKTF